MRLSYSRNVFPVAIYKYSCAMCNATSVSEEIVAFFLGNKSIICTTSNTRRLYNQRRPSCESHLGYMHLATFVWTWYPLF
jgi:alpha-D-ribose 1-methylphosphonate 5-phosphate C-P lyase